MTIAKTTSKSQFAGDGTTTAFAYPYRFFADSDLTIYLLDASSVETKLTLTTHYSVANNGDETGGTVTMVTSPASGEVLTILRDIPKTQATDYVSNDSFPANTHEAALDKSVLISQQISEKTGRSFVVPASDTATLEVPYDRASSFFAFDAAKNPIASSGGITSVPVSTFMATLLDDTSAAAARITLGTGVLDNIVEDLTPQLGGPLDTNGQPIDWSQGADVASAAELLVLRGGNSFNVTGTATVTSIETTANAWPIGSVIMVKFTGALTLTHHATNLVLLGGVNIIVAAGDWAVFRKYATGDWEMVSFNGLSATADWEAGTSTKPSLASPANVKSAVAAQTSASEKTAWVAGLPPLSAKTTVTHSLGTTPDLASLVIECTTIDGVFAIGDTISIDTYLNGGTTTRGITMITTAANVSVMRKSTAINLIVPAGVQALTESYWKHRMVVELIR